jgi:HEAT repeat protein/Flp pilus assembly protein TadD
MKIQRAILRAIPILLFVSIFGVCAAVAAPAGDAELKRLLTQLSDTDVTTRKNAAVALGNLGDKRAVDALIAALQNKNIKAQGVRHAVIDDSEKVVFGIPLTAGLGTFKVIGDIVRDSKNIHKQKELAKEQNEPVRVAAAEALGVIGDRRAVDPLLHELQGTNWVLQGAAAWAVGRFKEVRAIPPLIVLLNNEHDFVRTNAVGALVQIGQAAVQPLQNEIGRSGVRQQAGITAALDQIAHPSATPSSDSPPKIPALPSSLANRSPSAWAARQANTYNVRGNTEFNNKDYDSAIADYDKAIELNPQDAVFFDNRGNAKGQKHDFDGEIADCSQAIELNPQYARAYNDRGNAEYDKADYDGAIADYTKAIGLNSQDVVFYDNRGNAKAARNDSTGAIEDYDKAIELKPQFALAYFHRAMSKRHETDLDGAIADYTQYIALNPSDSGAYNNRGTARSAKMDFDGAIADFNKAIELNSTNAVAYLNRGRIKAEERDFDGAIADCNQALGFSPQNLYYEGCLWNIRGRAQAAKGDFDGAISNFDKAIGDFNATIEKFRLNVQRAELDSQGFYSSAYFGRAGAKAHRNDFDGAIADYSKVIEVSPQKTEAWKSRGHVKFERRDYDGAIVDYNKAIGLNPQDPVCYDLRGNAKEQKNDYDDAITDYDKAIELNPQYALAYCDCGGARIGRQDFEGAVTDYRKALEVDPQMAPDVVDALGKAANARVAGLLIGMLGDGQEIIRRTGSEALVKMGPLSEEPLIQVARDSGSGIRLSAIDVLGRIGDKRAVDPLISMLGDAGVRESAATALGRLGEPLGPIFSRICQGDEAAVRELAAHKDPRFVEPLLKCLSDIHTRLYPAAIRCLGEWKEPKAVDPIVKALSDSAPEYRVVAATSLGEIGDTRAIQPLISRLGDTNQPVRQAVADAVVRMGPLSVGPLLEAARDPGSSVRQEAINVLGKIGDKRSINPLIELLSEGEMRAGAAEALAALGEPLGMAFVKTLRGDHSALMQLTSRRDSRFVGQLVKSLKDKEPSIQKFAALALGQTGDPRAVASLIQALRKGGFGFRSRAGNALVRVGPPCVEPLIELLGDEDANLRALAADCLGRIRDPRAVGPLVGCLGDKTKQVSLAAAQSLRALSRPVAASSWAAPVAGSWLWPTRLRAGEYLVSEPRWLSVDYWRACGRMLLGWGSLGYSVLALALGAGAGSLWRRRLRGSVPGLGGWLVLLNLWLALCLCVPLMRLAGGWAMLMGVALVPAWISLCVGVAAGLSRWPMAKKRMEGFVCRAHFLRFHPGPGLNWLTRWSGRWLVTRPKARGNLAEASVCPACAMPKSNRFEGVKTVVAVLDDSNHAYPTENNGVLRVNWLKRKQPFDFDGVEVINAMDDDVEEFVRQTRYESDIRLQKRLQRMHCLVNAQSHFQRENTMTILRQTFGSVATG